jgi:hypothetical protein
MDIDAKVSNKILGNEIQAHIARIIHHNLVEFFLECQDILSYKKINPN